MPKRLAERAALPRVDPDDGPLWNRRGGSLSVCSITAIATGAMRDAGVGESAHALRHTLATRLLRERAADLPLIVDILGHADVQRRVRPPLGAPARSGLGVGIKDIASAVG